MTDRRHIIDGSEAFGKKYGLIYTCNLGWLDLGHMNPTSTRPHTGAAALWREINAGGPDVVDARDPKEGLHKARASVPLS